MAEQQPIRVVVEKKGGCFSGCGTTLAILLLIGLAVKYWYLSLGLVLIAVAVLLLRAAQEKRKAQQRTGPRDAWLNEVAVALAELGLIESARNTGTQLGSVPMEGDIAFMADGFAVYVNLFADRERARQAELGLRAKPEIRDAVSRGISAIRTVDRVVYVANGRGKILDEFRLDEVVRDVGSITNPPPLDVADAVGGISRVDTDTHSPVPSSPSSPDAIEQLRKLGELRAVGVLTDAEFRAKKAELLGRI
jgi:Short C-terminal domain